MQQLTNEQINELLLCMNDPVEFASRCKIQHPVKGPTSFDLYPFQETYLRFLATNNKTITNKSRQMGLSTCEVLFALWHAMMNSDQTVLIISTRQVAAMELLERALYSYEQLPEHLRARIVSKNKTAIEFDNGSRIFVRAASSSAGRGLAISLLIVDEMAFIAPRLAEDLWASLYPCVATHTRCIVGSTPGHKGEMFHQIWEGARAGTNGFVPAAIHWAAHPDRDDAWADPFRKTLGPERFAQEFENQFRPAA